MTDSPTPSTSQSLPNDITPYTISVPQSLLDNLSAKLSLRRLPVVGTEEDEADKDHGVSIADINRLAKYWEESYDWRAQESHLNSLFPQFTTPITVSSETVKIHFLWSRSTSPSAVPLLLLHGWPSSPFEFGRIIGTLSGEDEEKKSFHCVAPSLPGHAFSELPKTGWGVMKIAECFHLLMLKLGYTKYHVYGCDWGSLICRALALQYPTSVLSTHQNLILTKTPSPTFHTLKFLKLALSFLTGGGLIPGTYSAREVQNLRHVQKVVLRKEMGYNQMMSTKPATVSVALTDSPVGLLAWIWEKLEAWSDYEWSDDEVLTWVMLYYIPGPFGGARLYKDYQAEREAITGKYTNVPLGVSLFEGDLFMLPDDFAGMVQPVRFFRRHEKGGHFPGWEQPELLIKDIREFVDVVTGS